MKDELWKKIQERYTRARNLESAFKTPSRVELLRDSLTGTKCVVRISEAARKKPKNQKQGNPFLPYDPDLYVADCGVHHVVLLNKFNLVDRHILIVTKEFREQTEPLTENDVTATWSAVQSMPEGGVAYFNCGPRSGASQPHKHTQVVPLPLSEGSPLPMDHTYKTAIERAEGLRLDLPFVAFGVGIDAKTDPLEIHRQYQRMLTAAAPWLQDPEASYNLLWTLDWMILIPRSKEEHGPIGLKYDRPTTPRLNQSYDCFSSLGYAGTFFVKSEDEKAFLEHIGPMELLKEVGFATNKQ